jgi:hypothetical protein
MHDNKTNHGLIRGWMQRVSREREPDSIGHRPSEPVSWSFAWTGRWAV